MPTNIDDTHAAISYSSGWSVQRVSSQQWDGTASQTSVNGARATFRFRGTRIRMFVTVVAKSNDSSSEEQAVDVTLDSRSPERLWRHRHPDNFYNDQWFDSGDLPNGDHTIVVVNAESGPFALDRFEIEGSPISQSPVSPQPPSTTTTSRTTTSTRTSTSTSNTSSTSSSTSSTSQTSGSSTGTSTSTSATSTGTSSGTSAAAISGSHITVTATQLIPTGGGDTLPTPHIDLGSNTSKSSPPVGLILGGVLGTVGIILLAIVLFLLCRRRKRKMEERHILLPEAFSDNTPPPSASATQHTPEMSSRNTPVLPALYLNRSGTRRSSTDKYAPSESPNPATSSASPNTASPEHLLDVDAGSAVFRPHYLSGETFRPDNMSLYTSAPLMLADSQDIPPAYQNIGLRPPSHQFQRSSLPPFADCAPPS